MSHINCAKHVNGCRYISLDRRKITIAKGLAVKGTEEIRATNNNF